MKYNCLFILLLNLNIFMQLNSMDCFLSIQHHGLEETFNEFKNLVVDAAKNDQTKSLIIKSSILINTIYKNETFLTLAIEAGNKDIVEYLINRGAITGNALFKACEYYPRHLHLKYREYNTPNYEIIKILLSNLVGDVNYQDKYGETPLMKLIYNFRLYTTDDERGLEIVKFLLAFGADVNLKTKKGFSVLDGLDDCYFECHKWAPRDKYGPAIRELLKNQANSY